MSLRDCIAAAGRSGTIPPEKQMEMFDIFDENVKRLKELGLSEEDAIKQASKETFDEIKFKTANKIRQGILTAKSQAKFKMELENYTNAKGDKDPMEVMERKLAALESFEGVQRIESVERRYQAVLGKLHKNMADFLSKFRHTILGSVRNKALLSQVGKEIFEPGSSGSKAAEELAKAWIHTSEMARLMFNKAGGSIPKLAKWGLPQVHDQFKVASVSAKEWVEFLLNGKMLDVENMIDHTTGKAFNAEKLRLTLYEVYEHIRIQANTKHGSLGYGKFKLANSRLDHRFLKFKNFDSWNTYNNRFGNADQHTIMLAHLDRMAKDIAIMQKLSPDPDGHMRWMSQQVNDWVNNQAGKVSAKKLQKLKDKAASKIHIAESVYMLAKGDLHSPVHKFAARTMSGLRQLATAAYLGSASFLALGDFNLTRITSRFAGLPATKAMYSNLRTMFTLPNSTRRKIALTSGMVAEHYSTIASAGARVTADQTENPEWTRRISDFVLRTTGLSWLTQGGRWGAGMEFMAHLARMQNLTWEQMVKKNPKFAEYLRIHGIEGGNWEIIRATKAYDAGVDDPAYKGALYLRPDDITARTDINAELADDLFYRLMDAINTFKEFSVPMGSWKGAVAIGGKTRPGTVPGELMRSIMQFKNFPMTFGFTHITRGLNRKGFYGKAKYIVPLIISTGFMGMLAIQLKKIRDGKDVTDWEGMNPINNPAAWLDAILHGGGLGIYGDILFSTRYGSYEKGASAVLGAVPGFLFQTGDLIFGNMYEALHPDKEMNFGSDLARYLRKNTPGGNNWYMKMILERFLFETLEDMIDPKAEKKRNNRIKRTYEKEHTEFWWTPGDAAPERPPNLNIFR